MTRTEPLIGIPVKPFSQAKQRLARLPAAARAGLGRAVASHVLDAIRAARGDVLVIGDGSEVRHWADDNGVTALPDGNAGLDRAAAALRDHALSRGRPWLVLHADLPLVSAPDIRSLIVPLAAGSAVIAPSHDGGTSALGAPGPVGFAYGPGSFHRHLRRVPAAEVVVRPGLAFDIDTEADLIRLLARPAAAHLKAVVGEIDSAP